MTAQEAREGTLDGATRLADGITLAATLAREAPQAFDFFSRAVLPFEHREGETYMRCARRGS